MDKLTDSQKNQFFTKIKEKYEKSEINNNSKTIFLPTSIWDISIYKAWANIYCDLIPKMNKIKELLKKFVSACWADEAVLLEKNTLIKIVSYNDRDLKDNERFEKMTDVLKKIKNTCKMQTTNFKNIFIKTINNIIYVDEFDNSAYIIIAFKNIKTSLELVKLNIEIFKKSFKELFDNE